MSTYNEWVQAWVCVCVCVWYIYIWPRTEADYKGIKSYCGELGRKLLCQPTVHCCWWAKINLIPERGLDRCPGLRTMQGSLSYIWKHRLWRDQVSSFFEKEDSEKEKLNRVLQVPLAPTFFIPLTQFCKQEYMGSYMTLTSQIGAYFKIFLGKTLIGNAENSTLNYLSHSWKQPEWFQATTGITKK
jgi:hypothetical protein